MVTLSHTCRDRTTALKPETKHTLCQKIVEKLRICWPVDVLANCRAVFIMEYSSTLCGCVIRSRTCSEYNVLYHGLKPKYKALRGNLCIRAAAPRKLWRMKVSLLVSISALAESSVQIRILVASRQRKRKVVRVPTSRWNCPPVGASLNRKTHLWESIWAPAEDFKRCLYCQQVWHCLWRGPDRQSNRYRLGLPADY